MYITQKIWIYIAVVLVIIVGASIILIITTEDNNYAVTSTNNYILDFNEINNKLYVEASTWGLAGNHEEIIISKFPLDPTKSYSKSKYITFYTSELYYKIIKPDSLIIYAAYSSTRDNPENLFDPIKVKFVKLIDADDVIDYKKNYIKYGLNRISVFK